MVLVDVFCKPRYICRKRRLLYSAGVFLAWFWQRNALKRKAKTIIEASDLKNCQNPSPQSIETIITWYNMPPLGVSFCWLTEEFLGNLRSYTCLTTYLHGFQGYRIPPGRPEVGGTKYLQRTLYHTACSTRSMGCRTKTCCLKAAGDPGELIPEYFPPVDLTKKDLYLSNPVIKQNRSIQS